MGSEISPLRMNMAVTVDVVILTVADNALKTLLIKRANPPFQDEYALPGGFMLHPETAEEAALRVLKNKAGLEATYLEQLYTFDRAGRDPRGQVLSVTYFALVSAEKLKNLKGAATQEPGLFDVNHLPKLAFDHETIVQYGVGRLRNKLQYTNVVYSLLPRHFTLAELQRTYEIILGEALDKRNFRKKFASLDLIEPVAEKKSTGRHRPAQLFQFTQTEPVELDRWF